MNEFDISATIEQLQTALGKHSETADPDGFFAISNLLCTLLDRPSYQTHSARLAGLPSATSEDEEKWWQTMNQRVQEFPKELLT
jgi:hypothetical protein